MANEGDVILDVVVITHNEEKNLKKLVESFEAVPCIIHVVDSGSEDSTVSLAKDLGCKTYFHEWTGHANQINWALANLPLKAPWQMRMDADESLTKDLRVWLIEGLFDLSSDIAAIEIKRKVYFMGKWIRFGGFYPTWLLRIWRKGTARCEDRQMDEHLVLKHGSGKLIRKHLDIVDENMKGIDFWVEKHNRYAAKEVEDYITKRNGLEALEAGVQARRKRWFKGNVYYKLPIFLRALLYWVYRYFFQLGFLDGARGFVFHTMQAFVYRFLVDVKIFEAKYRDGSQT